MLFARPSGVRISRHDAERSLLIAKLEHKDRWDNKEVAENLSLFLTIYWENVSLFNGTIYKISFIAYKKREKYRGGRGREKAL